MAGDTEVVAYTAKKGRGSKRWTLAQLFDWSQDPKRKGRLKLIRLRSVDPNGVLRPGRIKQIVNSGEATTFLVMTKSGRSIRATAQHRFMTPQGWRRLEELHVGDRVMSNGLPGYANKEWIEQKYIDEHMTRQEVAALLEISDSALGKEIRRLGIKKPLAFRKNRRPGHGKPGMFSDEQRAKLSARMSGENNPQWKGDQVGPGGGRIRAQQLLLVVKCCGCAATKNLERHHLDKNPTNNCAANLIVLCAHCHKSFHFGQAVITVFSDEITLIERFGEERTFDIEMRGPDHNFVANGLVVHNSQESTRYCNYGKDKFGSEISVVQPSGLSDDMLDVWDGACRVAETNYFSMLANGVKPQAARSVLPTCLKTELVMTANFREWCHFINLRLSAAAHPDIRPIAYSVWSQLNARSPAVFGRFEENARTCLYNPKGEIKGRHER
ncbi:MAG: FAD-dependent thymidylate synthase [Acidimicrobiales bacterium]